MDIFINENKIDFELDGNETLKMVIDEVNSFLEKQDVSITKIMVNDINIDNVENIDISQVEKIEFDAKNSVELLLESIQELNIYLNKMDVGIKKVVEYLNEDSNQKALNFIISVIDGLEWIYNVLGSINDVVLEKYDINMLKKIFYEYEDILENLLDSLEEKDMIMLADILEFEMLEKIEEIKEKLPKLYDEIVEIEKKNKN
ncbi:MAG: hypothetical protein ACQERZ_04230 [Fusobacteriota bacterium]